MLMAPLLPDPCDPHCPAEFKRAARRIMLEFAGLRESGLGVGGIPYTMKEMQIEKMVVIRSKEL